MNSKWPFQLSPHQVNEVLNYVEQGYGERTIASMMGINRTQVDKTIRRIKDGTIARRGAKIIYEDELFDTSDVDNITQKDISMLELIKEKILSELSSSSDDDVDEDVLETKHEIELQLSKDLEIRKEEIEGYLEDMSVDYGETSRIIKAALAILLAEVKDDLASGKRRTLQVRTVHRAEEDEDMASLWDAVAKVNNKIIKKQLNLPYFDTVVNDPGPIAISFISDHHIAPYSPCDLQKMAEDAALIASTPGAYAILGGDGVDNHIKHHTAMMLQESTPDIQWQLYDHYLSLLNIDDSILVMISGNHDDWTMDFAGVDMVSRLSQKHKIHYAPDEAYINLKVGSQTYVVAMRHKYRFNSSANLGHTVKKWYDEGKMPFDIGCIGHHHEAHYEIFHKHGQDRIALRPGSYQISSPYARRNGFNPARPAAPTVVLWGDRREMMAFKDVKQGIDYLTYLREKE